MFKNITMFAVVVTMMVTLSIGCGQVPQPGNECYKEHYQNIRSEAKSVLKQIQQKQQVYHQANCTYLACKTPEDFQTLGVQLPDNCKYDYSVEVWANGRAFTAYARCNLDSDTTDVDKWSLHGDIWETAVVRFDFDDISKWERPLPPIPDVIHGIGRLRVLSTRTDQTIQITLPNGKYCYTWIDSDGAMQAKEKGLVYKLVHVAGEAFYNDINKLAHGYCPIIQIDGVDVKDFIDKIATEEECESFLGKLE